MLSSRLVPKSAKTLKALLNYFVDLCLLRTAPQDLPASALLLRMSVALYVVIGVVMIVNSDITVVTAFAVNLFEVLLMLTTLFLGLRLYGRSSRFQQTATALMGSGVLLGLLTLPLIGGSHQAQSTEAALLMLVLLIWNLVVIGHILRHAFDIWFGWAVLIAGLYYEIFWFLINELFPGTI